MKTNAELKSTPNLLIVNTAEDGGSGQIYWGGTSKPYGSVIWSWGGGWEHVSVAPYNRRHTPTWDEMCRLKNMFFHDDEVVVQYHPAKDDYVNNVPNCLHLWRPLNEVMPTPPTIMVGLRKGQTAAEYRREVEALL